MTERRWDDDIHEQADRAVSVIEAYAHPLKHSCGHPPPRTRGQCQLAGPLPLF